MKKLFISLLIIVPLAASAYTNPGMPAGFVNDYAGVLTAGQKQSLEQLLEQNRRATGNEIVVVTIASLEGDTIENVAVSLFQEWGIGGKEKDTGALLLIATDDRQMRIEVGYGLEPVLTDALSSRIIRNTIAPRFKTGDYYEGILQGVTQMLSAARGDTNAVPDDDESERKGIVQVGFFLILILFGFLQWFMSIMARTRSWWLGGIAGGVLGAITMFFVAFIYGLIVMAVLVPLGLLLDFFVSRDYARSKEIGRSPHWWAGGSWVGSGGRSTRGGFGGFGGGRSGGGGASGRW